MRTILTTGGAGFIGSNLVHHLLGLPEALKVVNLDALTYAGSLENLADLPDPARHLFVEGSINDRDLVVRLLEEHEIRTVIHLAAESHVDRSILGPGQFIETNLVGTFTLLEACRAVWAPEGTFPENVRFHHVSTDEVYGTLGPDDPAFQETTPYAPNSPYAASKAGSDHLVRAYTETYGLPTSLTNCSNNYGPYQFPEKLIPVIILNSLQGKPLPIYGDGLQVRDWLHVTDHCEAIWRVVEEGAPGSTYNVGGKAEVANIDLVRRICAILDEKVPDSPHAPHQQLITFVKDRPGHDRRYAMNIEKIEAELGWAPRESLDTGLEKTVQWYLDHTDWLRAIHTAPEFQQWMDENYQDRK
ncbi:MAG: dTDP-glucose 4,6-dehydratase [Deltaproteobacteria bacterium]|nr:dTDP-glucose 4,6-dehydratase [Deltaproteobacteria bacterium]